MMMTIKSGSNVVIASIILMHWFLFEVTSGDVNSGKLKPTPGKQTGKPRTFNLEYNFGDDDDDEEEQGEGFFMFRQEEEALERRKQLRRDFNNADRRRHGLPEIVYEKNLDEINILNMFKDEDWNLFFDELQMKIYHDRIYDRDFDRDHELISTIEREEDIGSFYFTMIKATDQKVVFKPNSKITSTPIKDKFLDMIFKFVEERKLPQVTIIDSLEAWLDMFKKFKLELREEKRKEEERMERIRFEQAQKDAAAKKDGDKDHKRDDGDKKGSTLVDTAQIDRRVLTSNDTEDLVPNPPKIETKN